MYDRFGRTLAYLDKADGWDYSVEAARAGAAHSYVYHGHPSARADEIAAAEQEAKAAGRGLWGPQCFGQTTSVPLIRPGSFAQRSGRAGGPSVGSQYLRDADVVALEFTAVAGGVPFRLGVIRVGRRLRPRKRLRGSRIRRTPRAAPDA